MQDMPIFDLSDNQRLMLYELLQELQKETGKPLVNWLHWIACAADPDGKSEHKLTLHPKWEIKKHREGVVTARGIGRGQWEVYYVPWKFNDSILADYREPPLCIEETSNLGYFLTIEGICVDRDEFRIWCRDSGHKLPHFWFPGEKHQKDTEIKSELITETQTEVTTPTISNDPSPQEEKSKAAKTLNIVKQEGVAQRYRSAVHQICSAIKSADDSGKEWHQRDYVEAWSKKNPDTLNGPSQQEGLAKKVNSALKKSPYNLEHKKIRRKQKK